MNPELQALLTVQQDDEAIREIEARLAALLPRFSTLDAARRRTAEEVARNEAVLEREGARLRAVESKLAEHHTRLDKSMAVLDTAAKLKEAAAASAQVEAARKAVAEDESELLTVSRRVSDVRAALAAHQEELERITAELAAVRESIGAEKDAIDAELAVAHARRAASAEVWGARCCRCTSVCTPNAARRWYMRCTRIFRVGPVIRPFRCSAGRRCRVAAAWSPVRRAGCCCTIAFPTRRQDDARVISGVIGECGSLDSRRDHEQPSHQHRHAAPRRTLGDDAPAARSGGAATD